jgi:hypothetical protein
VGPLLQKPTTISGPTSATPVTPATEKNQSASKRHILEMGQPEKTSSEEDFANEPRSPPNPATSATRTSKASKKGTAAGFLLEGLHRCDHQRSFTRTTEEEFNHSSTRGLSASSHLRRYRWVYVQRTPIAGLATGR